MARSSGYYAETAKTMHATKGEARRAEVRALRKDGGGSGGIRRVKKDGTEYFEATVKVPPTYKNTRRAPKKSAKNRRNRGGSGRKAAKRTTKAKGRSNGRKSKAKKNCRKNPGKALKSKIAQMKPNRWYPSTLSGAKVKVKRTGSKLVIMPAKKRRAS